MARRRSTRQRALAALLQQPRRHAHEPRATWSGAHLLPCRAGAGPDFVGSWNNLGVLDARMGDLDQARRDYGPPCACKPRQRRQPDQRQCAVPALGDTRQAQRLAGRLARVQHSDPFAQYMLGRGRSSARTIPTRSSSTAARAPVQQRAPFHFALARAYFLAGDTASRLAGDVSGAGPGAGKRRCGHGPLPGQTGQPAPLAPAWHQRPLSRLRPS